MCNVNLETSFAGTNNIKILKKIFIRLFIFSMDFRYTDIGETTVNNQNGVGIHFSFNALR